MKNVEAHLANKITVKLFLGIPLTFEIRSSLHRNQEWHQTLVKPFDERDLLEIHHANNDYIGLLLTDQWIHLQALKIRKEQLITRLTKYCPELNESTLKVYVFSQLYIS